MAFVGIYQIYTIVTSELVNRVQDWSNLAASINTALAGVADKVTQLGPAWAVYRNVPSSQNMNTFRVPGLHRISTPDTATITNLPPGMRSAGLVENLITGDGTDTWWTQRVSEMGKNPRTWWRVSSDTTGGWNAWSLEGTQASEITDWHVFLAVGQSNMSGRGIVSASDGGKYVQPRIGQFGYTRRVLETATVPLDMHDTSSGLSPATTFAQAYLKSQPNNVGVLIVPAAHGGTGFTTSTTTQTWTPGITTNPLYDLPGAAVTQANAALTAVTASGAAGSLKGILWHQGEDNGSMSQAVYAANLDALISYFRTQFSNPKLPFLVGQMVPEGITANSPGRANIDAAHRDTPTRVPYTAFAPARTNGYNPGDTTHMSENGVAYLGRNYVEAYGRAALSADMVEAKNSARDLLITQNTVWMGILNTGADLNTATGVRQRTSLYELGDYGVGISNMPPRPYRGDLEVISDYDGRNIVQRVTYDAASSPAYDGIYYRSGVDVLGDGVFTFGPWMRQLSDKDAPPAEKNISIVSAIKSGHGWTSGPGTYATFNLNDTSTGVVGDRAITITTDGSGNNSYVQKTGLNLDLSGKGLVVWLKANNLQSINSVTVTLGNADTFTPAWFAALPLSAGAKSPLSENEWFPVYLSFGNAGVNSGTPNRTKVTALRLNISDKAGMAAPTLKLGGVGTFQDRTARYPGGVVSLTFDDTYDTQATVAAPKLAEYGYAGTSYLIYDRIGQPGFLSLAQAYANKEVYGWEMAAHCTNSAAHVDWTAQSTAWIESELQAQKAWQQANGLPSDTFAYPIGPFNSTTARLVEKYYDSARSTYGWTNSAAHPHTHRLSCNVINASVSLATAKVWVDRAAAQGGWPVFLFHNLVASGATGNDWLISDFNSLVDYIAASGVAVDTVGNVIRQRP